MNRRFNIAIFAVTSSYIFSSIDAAGLRATNRSRTTTNNNDHNETTNLELRLTDDDQVKFYADEFANGDLNRDLWEKNFYASTIYAEDEDDSLVEEDDDQYRDPKTGGFVFDEAVVRTTNMMFL